jgi:hypothetical protein
LKGKEKRLYYAACVIMSLSIVHGACNLNIFPPLMVEILTEDDLLNVEPSVANISDYTLKSKLLQV